MTGSSWRTGSRPPERRHGKRYTRLARPVSLEGPVQPMSHTRQHQKAQLPPDGTPPAAKAPLFWECLECGYLSSDPSFADAREVCPLCGRRHGKRKMFPPDRQRLLDERIRRYYAEGEDEIVVILSAAMLEALLEDILDRIMAAHGADVAIRGTILDTVRAIGGRIGKLFPELTGVEFEDAAAELGYRDFPKRWRNLRAVRNAFIHDTPYRDVQEELGPGTALEAMHLLDQAYALFVLLNNRFVADGLKGQRRAGDEPAAGRHAATEDETAGGSGQ